MVALLPSAAIVRTNGAVEATFGAGTR
jgi:hypothetical protein